MSSIAAFMTADHRSCDAAVADLEGLAQRERWPEAASAMRAFRAAMVCHFRREEEHLFPAFEQATGNTQGPTAVMRMEHDQMRSLLGRLEAGIAGKDKKEVLGLTDSLMVLIQQHNMKEEQILYPMCDRVVPDAAAMVERLSAVEREE